MEQAEMDDIIAINKNQGPVMKIGNYWSGMDLKISIPDDVLELTSTVGALSDVISECLKKNNL